MAPSGMPTPTVMGLFPSIRHTDHFLVCNQSPIIYLMDMKGNIVRTYQAEKKLQSDFTSFSISQNGELIYAVAENKKLYCFHSETGRLETSFAVTLFASLDEARIHFNRFLTLKLLGWQDIHSQMCWLFIMRRGF